MEEYLNHAPKKKKERQPATLGIAATTPGAQKTFEAIPVGS